MCLVVLSRTVVTFLYTLASMKTYIPLYIRAIDTHIRARVPLEYRTNYTWNVYSVSATARSKLLTCTRAIYVCTYIRSTEVISRLESTVSRQASTGLAVAILNSNSMALFAF